VKPIVTSNWLNVSYNKAIYKQFSCMKSRSECDNEVLARSNIIEEILSRIA